MTEHSEAAEAAREKLVNTIEPIQNWLNHLSAIGSRRLTDNEYPEIYGVPKMGELRALVKAADSILAAFPIISLAPGKEGAREIVENAMLRHDADMQMTEETGDAFLEDMASAIAAFAAARAVKERAEEREACAKIADGVADAGSAADWESNTAEYIAVAIRARSTP